MKLIILDTEYTAWDGSRARHWGEDWEHREIIQLAALRAEFTAGDWQLTGEFNEFVRPTVNPQLSEYISQLTGISQAMIDNYGVDFASCYNSFLQFCGTDAAIAAWGREDIIINENLTLNNISASQVDAAFIDLHQRLPEVGYDVGHQTSGKLYQHFGLELQGIEHNALHDVHSLYLSICHLYAQDGRHFLLQ